MALDEVVGRAKPCDYHASADHKFRPHRCSSLRGPGGNRTCKTMYSTPAVECVLFPTKCSPEENLCVPSCFTTAPSGAGGTRTRTTLRSQSPDVLQQSVGMLFQMTNEVVEPETYGALPLSYGAKSSSRAGGTRTHNPRLPKHVLQLGSRSCFCGAQRSVVESCLRYGRPYQQHKAV